MIDASSRIREIANSMLADIDAYEAGRMSVDRLAFHLKSQIAALEQSAANAEWTEELRSLRNEVEYVSAFFIESGRAELNEDESNQLTAVLGELRAALVTY